MGLAVRRRIQCSARKSKNATRAARPLSRFSAALGTPPAARDELLPRARSGLAGWCQPDRRSLRLGQQRLRWRRKHVAGGFRSEDGVHAFAAVRPCLSRLRERFIDTSQPLALTFQGNPPILRLAPLRQAT